MTKSLKYEIESVKPSYPDRESPDTSPQYKPIGIFFQDDRTFLLFGQKIPSQQVTNNTNLGEIASVVIRYLDWAIFEFKRIYVKNADTYWRSLSATN
ncbi:hypothetical protein [Microcoleus sp. PH2017_08_TRC_O_A]|uniref:hypothetical protein n=1 Tax=Microcoleus sp. PH2017_08_TRC_O_A TaxID=2798819 RepID=UPI001D60A72B|nr:hypothetical protein [Microcoleus sp. PH2017_08_TRC_O_A]MCC3456924.1 hypothetical protein [Microcoleus sp. PH2017_08_TRC_O_A]